MYMLGAFQSELKTDNQVVKKGLLLNSLIFGSLKLASNTVLERILPAIDNKEMPQ